MLIKLTAFVFIIAVTIFSSVMSDAPAHAKPCGGSIPCECGDDLIASRTMDEKEPVLKGFCPGTALYMNTPGVSLVIKGPGPVGSRDPHAARGPGDGIHITADNVSIKGGKLEGFQRGIVGETNGSTILQVNADHNAINGISITGNGNTIRESKGTHNLGPNPEDGIVVRGNNNILFANYGQKTAPGYVGIRVDGTGNHIEDSFVEKGEGGGIWVTGGGNFDDGGNKVKKVTGTPRCEIDGRVCAP